MPGFRNPLVLGPVTFTPDAYPFRMHLNLDRSAVGFALLLLYRPLCREAGVARCGSALPARVQGLSCFLPLAPMLFTQGADAGVETSATAEFSMPWGQRRGLCEQDCGLSEQYWP